MSKVTISISYIHEIACMASLVKSALLENEITESQGLNAPGGSFAKVKGVGSSQFCTSFCLQKPSDFSTGSAIVVFVSTLSLHLDPKAFFSCGIHQIFVAKMRGFLNGQT